MSHKCGHHKKHDRHHGKKHYESEFEDGESVEIPRRHKKKHDKPVVLDRADRVVAVTKPAPNMMDRLVDRVLVVDDPNAGAVHRPGIISELFGDNKAPVKPVGGDTKVNGVLPNGATRERLTWEELKSRLQSDWKSVFPSAVVSKELSNENVIVLTHTMNGSTASIDGLTCRSPLCNNALASFERTGGTWLNLYEIMVPDQPGSGGAPGTSEIYTTSLINEGKKYPGRLTVDGNHYHWSGQSPFAHAVHHKSVGMHPLDFSAATIASLRKIM